MGAESRIDVIAESENGIRLARKLGPDALIMDMSMMTGTGYPSRKEVRHEQC